MRLNKVTEFADYQKIVDAYNRKGCKSNDYIQQEASDIIVQGSLYEFCDKNNAFFFVRKDTCLRVYYYLNDFEMVYDFSGLDDLLVEIIFRGSNGLPEEEIAYLSKCGFKLNLRRDQYCGVYDELEMPRLTVGINVRLALSKEEVRMACDLFNKSFDKYSGDFISEAMIDSFYENGNILVAVNSNENFMGALHQTRIRNVAWASHLAVMKEFRGMGIGQTLIDSFIEANKFDERSRYMLWVQANNTPAVNMYQKKGFKYTNKSTISMLKLNQGE